MAPRSRAPVAPGAGSVEADGRGPQRRRRLVAFGFGASALAGIVLSADLSAGPPILGARWGILARLALWSLAWVLGVACALRLPPGVALAAVMAVALALRLAALAGPPPMSDDLFRYSWDGRVQTAGIDPYRYPPEDPAVADLREGWLWPDTAGCAEIDRPPGCTRVNRPMVRTIYPPLAEAWFTVVYRLTGIGAHHKTWQVAGVVTDLALVALLVRALRRRGRDPRWVALYALSPFPVVEVVANGHVDGLAALLLVAALAVAGSGRRAGLGGALVGAATLVKLYPAVALVALVGRPACGAGRRGLLGSRPASPVVPDPSTAHEPALSGRFDWTGRAPALAGAGVGFAVVLVVGYLPHVLAVGPRVVGYLPGYLQEERYDEGTRFLLVGLLARSPDPATFGAALALALVAAWVLLRRPDPAAAAAVLVGGLLLVTTPVQPWYAISLLAVATLAVRPAWALVAAGAYPYFFAVILDHPRTPLIGQWGYGLALVGVAGTAGLRAVAARRRSA